MTTTILITKPKIANQIPPITILRPRVCTRLPAQLAAKDDNRAEGIPIMPVSKADFPTPCCKYSATMTQMLRSEEHTSELQSRPHLVCRLLLEKKKKKTKK